MKSCSFALLFSLVFCISGFAASVEDALRMTEGKSDSVKVKLLDSIARKNRNDDPAFALELLSISLPLSKSISPKYYTRELILISKVYRNLSKYANSIDKAREACKILLETGDTLAASDAYVQMGSTYYLIGSYDLAMNNYFESLKIGHKYNSKETIAVALTNMGNIYTARENFSKALDYYLRALPFFSNPKDKARYVLMLDNISLVYQRKKEFAKAKFYNSIALHQIDSVEMKFDYANILINGGSILSETNEINTSLAYFYKAMRIAKELENRPIETLAMMNIGNNLVQLGKYTEAVKMLEKALANAEELDLKIYISLTSQNLSQAYEKMGNTGKAYAYFKKHIVLEDSLFSAESVSQTNEMITRYETEQREKEVELLEQKNQLKSELLQRDNILLYASSASGVSLVILALVLFTSDRNRKRSNELLKLRNREIQDQKQIIQDKNKDITDSIRYAQRIQQSILPESSELKKLLPGSFVLYMPKDVVSGDFYWIACKKDLVVLAVADCTGHGVPGALMSMIGTTLLNEIVSTKGITQAPDILFRLREGIIHSLKQTGATGENKDGMDISLCVIEESKRLFFAGANNPLVHIRNGKLTRVKADPQPIGIYSGAARPYSEHEIQLEKGDAIYMFTDGFADQFGGPREKKFKSKALEKLLLDHAKDSPEQQAAAIKNAFEQWKGNLEQVDDVCLIGVTF